MQKSNAKILLLENIHAEAARAFEARGYQVESLPKSLPEADLRDALTDVVALGCGPKPKSPRH